MLFGLKTIHVCCFVLFYFIFLFCHESLLMLNNDTQDIASFCKQSLMKRYFFVSVIQKITRNLKGLTREAIAIHTSVIINLYSMIICVCVCVCVCVCLCVWVCVWLSLSYTWYNSMQCWIILSCHQSIV